LASDILRILKENLPAVPGGIIGREEYFQSAVLLPLIRTGEDWEILFQIRASGIRQGDEICFPGGRFDQGEDRNFRDTAVRETCEELGIDPKRIRVLGHMNTLLTPMGVLVEPYVASLDISSTEELAVNPQEVARIFTLPLSRLQKLSPESYFIRVEAHSSTRNPESGKLDVHFPGKKLKLPKRYHDSWGNRKHKILAYQTDFGVIWGITARILAEFIELLKP
jgi:peroxisomal coenzyme A diphosphatase NUDT7